MSGGDRSEAGEGTLERDFLREVVDKVPSMLAYWDTGQRCRYANRAYEIWFGVAPRAILGKTLRELLGATIYALNRPHIEAALRGEPQEFEREIPDPAGGPPRQSQATYVPDVEDGVVRGFCVVVTDITRRKKAEEALHLAERQVQAQERLTALSTLAAGIAHEINNPLAAVLGNLELTLERLAGEPIDTTALRPALIDAKDAAERIRAIVRSVRLLARGTETALERVDVNDTVERSIALTSNAIRYRAGLVRDLRAAGRVDGNAAQLAQVFVNLLLNAAEALPEETAGSNEIRITTFDEGAWIVIEVSDNGRGIPQPLLTRIFEPFFTTRDVGEGMGLGLAISSGIVQALGGTITVRSSIGYGSTFRVELPAAPALAERPSAPVPPRAPSPAPSAPARRPRLLVIDDEVALTTLLAHALERDNDVTVANGGADALRILEKSPEFDLVLCDLMMPEMSGEEVYREVTRRWPALTTRFAFMTGGAFTERGRGFLDSVAAPKLEKPFPIARVRELVSARTAATKGRAGGGGAT